MNAMKEETPVSQLSIWQLLDEEMPPIVEPPRVAGDTIETRFEKFHALNPHVFNALRELALSLKRGGQPQYSIAALFEVLRFRGALRTQGDGFKLNNSYRALYARKIMKDVPELAGFFETRRRHSEQESSWLMM